MKNFGDLNRRRCERRRWILSTAFKKDIGRRTAADSEMRAREVWYNLCSSFEVPVQHILSDETARRRYYDVWNDDSWAVKASNVNECRDISILHEGDIRVVLPDLPPVVVFIEVLIEILRKSEFVFLKFLRCM